MRQNIDSEQSYGSDDAACPAARSPYRWRREQKKDFVAKWASDDLTEGPFVASRACELRPRVSRVYTALQCTWVLTDFQEPRIEHHARVCSCPVTQQIAPHGSPPHPHEVLQSQTAVIVYQDKFLDMGQKAKDGSDGNVGKNAR